MPSLIDIAEEMRPRAAPVMARRNNRLESLAAEVEGRLQEMRDSRRRLLADRVGAEAARLREDLALEALVAEARVNTALLRAISAVLREIEANTRRKRDR